MWARTLAIGLVLLATSAARAQALEPPPSSIDAEIQELQRQRNEIGLALPIAVSVGGVVLLGGGLGFAYFVFLVNALGCGEGEDLDNDDCPSDGAIRTIEVSAAVAGVGAVVLGIGLFLLFDRLAERRAIGRKIKELRVQWRPASAPLALSVGLIESGAGFELRF